MTDETPKKRTRRPRPASPDGAPPTDVDSGGAEDPDDALRRLESMGSAKPAPGPAGAAPLPPTPAVDSFGPPPSSRRPRSTGSSGRTTRSRPRPAAASTSTRVVARIAAPIVFLVAVIALIGIVVQSGVMGSDGPAPTPGVEATKANGVAKTTKKYVVKSGDSLSSIAVRFSTTTSVLKALNPDLGNTLAVGTRIVVPTQ